MEHWVRSRPIKKPMKFKMLWVNWVVKRLRKFEFRIDNDMWKIKILLFTLLVTYVHRECIFGMAECTLLFIKKVALFRKPSKIRNNCKWIFFKIMFFQIRQTNLYCHIPLLKTSQIWSLKYVRPKMNITAWNATFR
jgi:hypothetical protein